MPAPRVATPSADSVDLLGFRLSLTPAESAERSACLARAAKVAEKWSKLSVQGPSKPPSSPTPPPSSGTHTVQALCDDPSSWRCASVPIKVKLAVREGIPAHMRPLVWAHMSGASSLRATAPSGYFPLTVRAAGVHSLSLTQLESDLSLVSPSHPALYSRKVLEAVRRVVMGYGVRNPEVGYNQHLSGLALFLLLVLGTDAEEDAFWLLAALLENILPPAYYEDCKGCAVEQRVFTALLGKKCPRLTAVMDKLDVSVQELTSSWFLSLFTNTLPAETTVRVWDWLMCEGPKVLFRVGLALFRQNEGSLLNTLYGTQMPRMLHWRVSRTYNVDALGKVAFKGIGSLSSVEIQKLRSELEHAIRDEIEAQRRRIDALCAPAAQPLTRRRISSEPALNAIAEESDESGGSSDSYYLSE